MEIKLNYTQEELSTLLDGLNNACMALANVYSAAYLGCDIPGSFIPMFEHRSLEEIEEVTKLRYGAVRQLYNFLLAYEEK